MSTSDKTQEPTLQQRIDAIHQRLQECVKFIDTAIVLKSGFPTYSTQMNSDQTKDNISALAFIASGAIAPVSTMNPEKMSALEEAVDNLISFQETTLRDAVISTTVGEQYERSTRNVALTSKLSSHNDATYSALKTLITFDDVKQEDAAKEEYNRFSANTRTAIETFKSVTPQVIAPEGSSNSQRIDAIKLNFKASAEMIVQTQYLTGILFSDQFNGMAQALFSGKVIQKENISDESLTKLEEHARIFKGLSDVARNRTRIENTGTSIADQRLSFALYFKDKQCCADIQKTLAAAANAAKPALS